MSDLLRVIYGYVPGSRVPSYSQAELWSSVHIGMAIVCACLPPLRPLFSRVWLSSVKAHYNSLRKSVSFRTRGSAQTSSNEGAGESGKSMVVPPPPRTEVCQCGARGTSPHEDGTWLASPGEERTWLANLHEDSPWLASRHDDRAWLASPREDNPWLASPHDDRIWV